MKVVGLITEYNPFHKGHQFHLNTAKERTKSDYCIAVMSGHFVQRGTPALADKWTRAASALKNGADLVIELPVHYATSSAEFFAHGAVSLLNDTGIVDFLCFGSEAGDIESLDKVASILANESEDFKASLNSSLKQGYSFPFARASALKDLELNIEEALLSEPNNILGIEYIKALKKLGSSIEPITIQRVGSHYHNEKISHEIASATAIRSQLQNRYSSLTHIEKFLPNPTFHTLQEAVNERKAPVFPEDIFPFLQYKLITSSKEELRNIQDVTEGLENRILNSTASSYDMLLNEVATKRYTKTKVSRALLHILLGLDQKTFSVFNKNGYSQYIRILGFKKESRPLMKKLKENARIPIIVNIKSSEKKLTTLQHRMLMDEVRATKIYQQILQNSLGGSISNDFTQSILIL